MAEDHIDRFLRRLATQPGAEAIDLEVEGIVDRVGGINRRIKRAMEATLAEHGLTLQDWEVLCKLKLRREANRSSPGSLAAELELSTGAMTSRLDRLERERYVRRLPDPEDRRSVAGGAHAGGPCGLGPHRRRPGSARGVLRLGADEGRAAAS